MRATRRLRQTAGTVIQRARVMHFPHWVPYSGCTLFHGNILQTFSSTTAKCGSSWRPGTRGGEARIPLVSLTARSRMLGWGGGTASLPKP